MYRVEVRRLSRRRALTLIFLIFLLTCVTNSVHRFYVDHSAVSATSSNLAWQIEVQERVMESSPAVAPHSYRFLPNSIVRWMQLCRFSYESARDTYRLIFGLVLYYAMYRYARLYANYAGAIIALLLVAVVYPVSFEYYAGQLTDPLSHLSFVLAFIFLETGDFGLLLATLLIGSLAKETVIAMAGYYVIFCRGDKHYLARAATLSVGSLAVYLGVRAFVLKSSSRYGYEQVSGVAPGHLWVNLAGGRWLPLVLLTAGAFVPFLIAGYKQTPASLKRQAGFLFPVLFVSSALFGWLFEARNFMPLVFVLAVAGGMYLSRLTHESEAAS